VVVREIDIVKLLVGVRDTEEITEREGELEEEIHTEFVMVFEREIVTVTDAVTEGRTMENKEVAVGTREGKTCVANPVVKGD